MYHTNSECDEPMTYYFSLQIGPLRGKNTVLENRYFSIVLVIVLLNNAVIYVGGNVTNIELNLLVKMLSILKI